MTEPAKPADPYPLTPTEVAQWSEARHKGLDGGTRTVIYHTPDAPRLPGWTPSVANVALAVKLVDQPGGKEVAEFLVSEMKTFLERLPKSVQNKILVIPPEKLHLTIGYFGLKDLQEIDPNFPTDPAEIEKYKTDGDGTPSYAWRSILRHLNTANYGLIRQLDQSMKNLSSFVLQFRGIQMVNNSLVFRALVGGAEVNVMTAALSSSIEGLKGNDPYISPKDKNEVTKAWGMAAHTTGALVAAPFPQWQGAWLMHTRGRGIVGKTELQVTKLSLVAQTYGLVTVYGNVVGTPFAQDSLATFELGRGLVVPDQVATIA